MMGAADNSQASTVTIQFAGTIKQLDALTIDYAHNFVLDCRCKIADAKSEHNLMIA